MSQGVTASSSASGTAALSTAPVGSAASSASTASATTIDTTSSPHVNVAAFTNVQAVVSNLLIYWRTTTRSKMYRR